MAFSGEFYPTFKEKLTSILLMLFQKCWRWEKAPKLIYEASITLIPKPDKDIKKKNHRQLFLMNTDANFLNKILANWIQQYIKKIIYHNQVAFVPQMQGWYNVCKSIKVIHHMNKMNDKKHDHINRYRKSSWENLASIYDKNSQ